MKTQLVILAAGVGSRLNPLTVNIPKTMVKVNSRPMIDYILNTIDENKIKEIIIAVGHKRDKITYYLGNNYKSIPIKYVFNSRYLETNSIYSMWLLKEFINEDCVVINADTIFDFRVLENLMNSNGKILVSVDDFIAPPLDDDAMKVTIQDEKIIDIRKDILPANTMGDAIGLYRFKNEGIKFLYDEIEICLNKNIDNQLFTHAVNNLTNQTKVLPVSTGGFAWYEIDTMEDLKLTEKKLLKADIFRENF